MRRQNFDLKHLQEAELVEGVWAVVRQLAEGVPMEVCYDELGQRLKMVQLLQMSNSIVAHIQLHQVDQ